MDKCTIWVDLSGYYELIAMLESEHTVQFIDSKSLLIDLFVNYWSYNRSSYILANVVNVIGMSEPKRIVLDILFKDVDAIYKQRLVSMQCGYVNGCTRVAEYIACNNVLILKLSGIIRWKPKPSRYIWMERKMKTY